MTSQIKAQTFQALPTNQLTASMFFSLGQIDPSVQNGFEMNFWIQPFYTAAGIQQIIQVSSDIAINLYYNPIAPALMFNITQNANSGNASLPAINTNWINCNLRIEYGVFTLFSAWQGNNWYKVNPDVRILLSPGTTPYYTNSTFEILPTANTLGANIADIRVFSYEPGQSWGEFMAFSTNPYPPKFTYTLSQLYIQSGTYWNQNGQLGNYDLSAITLTTFNVPRCANGYGIQNGGACGKCLTAQCYVCEAVDSNYFNLCRWCNQLSSACYQNTACPTGYYNEFGICYQCPQGCSACLNASYCTGCASGLVVTQNATTPSIYYCDCPQGQFGTYIAAISAISCAYCDPSCLTCTQNSFQCTSCSAPKFLYNKQCVTNCAAQVSNYYGEKSNNTCQPCATNCLACTGPEGCTNCGQQNVSGNMTQLLNFAGTCVLNCPSNSIPQLSSFLCNKCNTNCALCNQTTINCTKCTQGYSLYVFTNTSGACQSNCPDGYYSQNGYCKKCDPSCVLCDGLNYCTQCTYAPPPATSYYFLNYQCVASCPQKFYADSSNPSYWFCRSCPSNCLSCTSQTTCTTCAAGYYMSTYNGFTLCVLPQYCPAGQYPNLGTSTCQNCKSNCLSCTTSSNCFDCNDGYFLDPSTTNCLSSCALGYYALPSGTCSPCISNCKYCSDSYTCNTCNAGYLLLQSTSACTAGPTCPSGTYLNAVTSTCIACKYQCTTCTSASVCTGCILDYTLTGSLCISNCGNGIRQPGEQCDDGNLVNGDGCSSKCTIEPGFICIQATPDVCECDPGLISAEWSDFYGTIDIQYSTSVYYNSSLSPESSDQYTFCSQILTSSTLANLGSYYQCSLSTDNIGTIVEIEVGSDSTLGSNAENYNASISLIPDVLWTQGCTYSGIQTNYLIQNLPIDTPLVIFQLSSGTNTIGACAQGLLVSLVNSKGLTKRTVQVYWTVQSMTPSDLSLTTTLQNNILNDCSNQISCYIDQGTVASLVGKTVIIKALVTNFLGVSSSNLTTIVFSTSKKLDILDVTDIVDFQITSSNFVSPRFRIPYCPMDSTTNSVANTFSITYTCQLYPVISPSTKTPLINCTIPANAMNINYQYSLLLTANVPGQSSYQAQKVMFIQPNAAPIAIAIIQGCNRLFQPNNTFNLSVVFNTNPSTTTFVWSCIDVATGSTCFSQDYYYISFGNTEEITIPSDIFFFGMQYIFSVNAYDSVSQTSDTQSCYMLSSNISESVIDLIIVSEVSQTGFMDLSLPLNSFKAQLLSPQEVNMPTLNFTWQFTDQNDDPVDPSGISIYYNSISVNTSYLNSYSQYVVVVTASDGRSLGVASQTLQTAADISNEFRVEPDTGESLSTIFTFSVTSQKTFESLNQYLFGYLDPVDGVTRIPVYQKTFKKFITLTLPQLPSGSTLTCFVDVIQPNNIRKTFYSTVTLSATSLQASDILGEADTIIMDDMIMSVQMKNNFDALSSEMDLSDEDTIIILILEGLQMETTPLSDMFIQDTSSSLLEFVSEQTSSLLSNSTIVSMAADLFIQITITENSQTQSGYYSKFGQAATASLFNFANNIFTNDFSSLIGLGKLIQL